MSQTTEGSPAPPTLRYDSDCAFCSASARWLEARARGRVLIEPAPGIGAAELEAGGGSLRRGGAALTAAYALATRRRWVRLLDAPGASILRDAAYRTIVRARWLLSRLANSR